MEFRRVLFRSSDYEKERGERIDELLADTGKQAKLDILFLSHIHEDHVNGVEKLLDKTDGLKVDTIVLTLLPIEDRLIAFRTEERRDGDEWVGTWRSRWEVTD